MKHRNAPSSFRQAALRQQGLLVLIGLLSLVALAPGRVQAQAPCEQALASATGYYYDARFEEAISLLKGCLEQGAFSQDDQLQAYTLLSLACFANRHEADARKAIRILLSLTPDYTPDPLSAQPSYRALVEDVRREMQPVVRTEPPLLANTLSPALTATNVPKTRRGLGKWLYFGGGALLTSAAILLLSSSGQSNPPPGQGQNPPPPPR